MAYMYKSKKRFEDRDIFMCRPFLSSIVTLGNSPYGSYLNLKLTANTTLTFAPRSWPHQLCNNYVCFSWKRGPKLHSALGRIQPGAGPASERSNIYNPTGSSFLPSSTLIPVTSSTGNSGWVRKHVVKQKPGIACLCRFTAVVHSTSAQIFTLLLPVLAF